MITRDTETPDLRVSPPGTVGSPGIAVRLADLFRAVTSTELPPRPRAWAGSTPPFEDGRLGVDQILAARPDGMVP